MHWFEVDVVKSFTNKGEGYLREEYTLKDCVS